MHYIIKINYQIQFNSKFINKINDKIRISNNLRQDLFKNQIYFFKTQLII